MPAPTDPLDRSRTALAALRAAVVSDLVSGDPARIVRRYVLGALAAGLVLGCLVARLSVLAALVVILAGGFGIGYAARSYVSHRRRQRFLSERT